MGVPIMPGELREPVSVNDIRRWVQAMHYPNPLHYDDAGPPRAASAGSSRRSRSPSPPTRATAAPRLRWAASPIRTWSSAATSGGSSRAGSFPGDKVLCHRQPFDYKVSNTSFAGPTCFQRGDTLYINQRGERIALQRSTAIRYQVRQAKEKQRYTAEVGEPEWTAEQLDDAGGHEAARSSSRSTPWATTSGCCRA